MLESLGGLTGDVVMLALDAALQRHKVIAQNIANSNTQGFIPMELTFEDQFSLALKNSTSQHGNSALKSDLQSVAPEVREAAYLKGQDDRKVFLDQQIVELAKNTIQYKALLEGMAKKGDLIKMAIKEGRG